MKKTILISLLLSLSTYAGDKNRGGGHEAGGGDLTALQFTSLAQEAIKTVETMDHKLIKLLPIAKLKKAIKTTRVVPTKDPLFLKNEKVDALNFPKLKLIKFDESAFTNKNHFDALTFTIHEYAGIAGLKDNHYQITGRILSILEKNQQATLPAISFTSPKVMREMTKAAIDTQKLWKESKDEVDAEKSFYASKKRVKRNVYEYYLDYFSAEHYSCSLALRHNTKKNTISVYRSYRCEIE